MERKDFDAVVVGSGPNGMAAAITLQRAGLSVLLMEGQPKVGGGMRSAALTLPGFLHDVCSAVHPMAAGSPFFNHLPLGKFGLEYISPPVCAAHPFDDGSVALLHGSVEDTAQGLGADREAYKTLITPISQNWDKINQDILGPLHFPDHPVSMTRFGWRALSSALSLSSRFKTPQAKGLWAGMAAHAIQPLGNLGTSAIGLVLMVMGHRQGWPIIRGGTHKLAEALAKYFLFLGGKIETNLWVSSLKQLPSSHTVFLDVTPKQLLAIAGHKFSALYKWQLNRYRYGEGIFKIDWALDDPVPFRAGASAKASTVHLGGTLEDIASTEYQTAKGKHPERPFVLLAQPSLFDDSRAPTGKHTAWAYCHVPHGSTRNMTKAIEDQVERFAPGFRDRILARHTMTAAEMENYNPNYIGGDINGGIIDIRQLFTRPALRSSPYQTSAKGIYICSSSTPPGGGVHGMCGYQAAKRALKDVFHRTEPILAT